MSYVKRTLQSGEIVELEAKLHWINYLVAWMLLAVGGLMWLCYLISEDYNKSDLSWLVLFFCGWGGYQFLKLWVIEMAVTNKRVVLRKGIIAIDTDELKNMKIESIEVEQTVMGRILNYGNVCFGGVGVGKLVFANVAKPLEVKRRAEEIVGE